MSVTHPGAEAAPAAAGECILRLRGYAVRRETQRKLASGEVPMGGTIWAGLKLVVKDGPL